MARDSCGVNPTDGGRRVGCGAMRQFVGAKCFFGRNSETMITLREMAGVRNSGEWSEGHDGGRLGLGG